MLIIFFILGLTFGSFLNVVIARLHTAETLMGHSKCPHCQAKIRWYDNIPLFSFAVLGTRCRDCKEKISWQYPLVEFSTGVLFSMIGACFFSPLDPQSWLETLFYMLVISGFIVIFAYDFKFMEIPMIIIWLGVGTLIVYYLYADFMNFEKANSILSMNLYSGTLAGISAFLFFFILSAASKEKLMGMGDAYAALFIGLVVGWHGILLALILAFTLGAVYGIILMSLGKKKLKSRVPFAPFLVAGAVIVIFLPYLFPEAEYWLPYF